MQALIFAFILPVLVFLIIFLYYYSKHHFIKVFDPDIFVIKLRNGSILNTFQGGKISFLPLIDEFITIPMTEQVFSFDIFNKNPQPDKNFELKGSCSWKVSDPADAYSKFNWDPTSSNYCGFIIKNVVESKIQTVCANTTISDLETISNVFIFRVKEELKQFFDKYAISITSLIISDIIPIAAR